MRIVESMLDPLSDRNSEAGLAEGPQQRVQVGEIGGLLLDPVSHRVTIDGKPADMGPTEYRLLQFFMTHQERAYTRGQLLDQVWGGNVYVEERTVYVHIRRLRNRLGAFSSIVRTIGGAGYRYDDHPDVTDLQVDLTDAGQTYSALAAVPTAVAGVVDTISGAIIGLDADDDQWATVMDVNLMAHVRAARLLVPGWVERGRGYFASTASAAGLLTQIGSATYTVSKHGAVAFAEWLAVTYGAQGVGVSCL